jgi:hypothetical protein
MPWSPNCVLQALEFALPVAAFVPAVRDPRLESDESFLLFASEVPPLQLRCEVGDATPAADVRLQ